MSDNQPNAKMALAQMTRMYDAECKQRAKAETELWKVRRELEDAEFNFKARTALRKLKEKDIEILKEYFKKEKEADL